MNTGGVPTISITQKKVTFFQVVSWKISRILLLLTLNRIRQTRGTGDGDQGCLVEQGGKFGWVSTPVEESSNSFGWEVWLSAATVLLGRLRREVPEGNC